MGFVNQRVGRQEARRETNGKGRKESLGNPVTQHRFGEN